MVLQSFNIEIKYMSKMYGYAHCTYINPLNKGIEIHEIYFRTCKGDKQNRTFSIGPKSNHILVLYYAWWWKDKWLYLMSLPTMLMQSLQTSSKLKLER